MSSETIASAHARAEARISVIVTQISYVVRQTTGSTFIRQVLEMGMVSNQWISSVEVFAYDDNDQKWASIQLQVDWAKHKINLYRHGTTVMIDEGLPEGERLSWVIGEIANWFKSYKEKSQLHTNWTIKYTPEIEGDRERRDTTTRLLGLVYAPTKKWAHGTERELVLADTPADLNELSIVLHVAT